MRGIGDRFSQIEEPHRSSFRSDLDQFNLDLQQRQMSTDGYVQTWDYLAAESERDVANSTSRAIGFAQGLPLAVPTDEQGEAAGGLQIIKDVVAAIVSSPAHAPELLGDVWENIIKPYWSRCWLLRLR